MSWMKFVHQVFILGDEKEFSKAIERAEKSATKLIKYRGEIIDLDRAKAIKYYLELYNQTNNDLLHR
tara:strand:- start:1259 stop:1459 length:201 start_codon:yes stop_codon:yes gene_type:complete